MENELFDLAVQASTQIPLKNVIGTKGEYRIHGALKYFFQPDDRFHEVKVDGFICDAVSETDEAVTEIQTRAFSHLKKKLEHLTKTRAVTVIYPMIVEKRVIVTYAESGETSVRKSPKKARYLDFFKEIYSLRDMLGSKNLHFKLVKLTADEYRVYKGSKNTRKPFQKPVSTDRIPTELIEIISLESKSDFEIFIPKGLPERFGTAEFSKRFGITRAEASYVINPLIRLGLINKLEIKSKTNVYELSKSDE